MTKFYDFVDLIGDNPEIVGVVCFLAPLIGVAVAIWITA